MIFNNKNVQAPAIRSMSSSCVMCILLPAKHHEAMKADVN